MEIRTIERMKQPANFEKNSFERIAWTSKTCVVGIDEVGRGCLAGPLVTGAVILPLNTEPDFLQDSKKMTAKQREQAAAWIQSHCRYQIGMINHRAIDEHNIYQATLLGMKKALVNLLAQPGTVHPSAILVDAMPLKIDDLAYTIPVHNFIKGEERSSSIAAASIIAKVARDRIMDQLSHIFPGYSLEKHKGYATKVHGAAIRATQHSLIHRVSFLGSFNITAPQKITPAKPAQSKAIQPKAIRRSDEIQQSLC